MIVRSRDSSRNDICRQKYRKEYNKFELLAWKLAGILNKEQNFWNYVRNYNIFKYLSETWLERKDNYKIKRVKEYL